MRLEDLRENFIVIPVKSLVIAPAFALKIPPSMALHLSLIKLARGRDLCKGSKSFVTGQPIQSLVGVVKFDVIERLAWRKTIGLFLSLLG